jgi:hypothetical protein
MWRSAAFNKGALESKREGSPERRPFTLNKRMTMKPSSFEKAIAGSYGYAVDFRAKVREGKGAREGVHYANDPK